MHIYIYIYAYAYVYAVYVHAYMDMSFDSGHRVQGAAGDGADGEAADRDAGADGEAEELARRAIMLSIFSFAITVSTHCFTKTCIDQGSVALTKRYSRWESIKADWRGRRTGEVQWKRLSLRTSLRFV